MPNPFFFAGKITNAEHFVGREKELKKIFGYLDVVQTGQIQHTSLVGERRMGKSSLLYHVSQIYQKNLPDPQKYCFIYLDLDDPHCHTLHGLLRHILEKLDLPSPTQPTLEKFYRCIENKHVKDNIWPVLLMDEFEHLPQRAAEFPDNFYDALRSLGNNNLVGLLTASQHPLHDLADQGKLTSPFFNIFHQIDLGEFADTEANALLNRGRVSDQPFTEDDCSQILKIAGKCPARLQIVASLAYEAKFGSKKPDWKAIKADALKEPPFINHYANLQKTKNWFSKLLAWLFWTIPQYIGHMLMVLIGRGRETNDTTDRIAGYIIIAIPIALWLGVISWPLVTKWITRLSQLFFQK